MYRTLSTVDYLWNQCSYQLVLDVERQNTERR